MTTEQFTYWLQGFMEVADPKSLSERQTQIIKDHLKLVFDKQTPDRNFIPPLAPIPTTPYPIWQEPHRVICSTNSYDNVEDPMTKIYCSHMVPQDMFGKKEEDVIGTEKLEVTSNRRKFRGGLKC